MQLVQCFVPISQLLWLIYSNHMCLFVAQQLVAKVGDYESTSVPIIELQAKFFKRSFGRIYCVGPWFYAPSFDSTLASF